MKPAKAYAAAVLLFAYVLIRWPGNFYADDSYFYFQVAWNIARGAGSTFNNIVSTNGYHPCGCSSASPSSTNPAAWPSTPT